jgi:hypothetical protein
VVIGLYPKKCTVQLVFRVLVRKLGFSVHAAKDAYAITGTRNIGSSDLHCVFKKFFSTLFQSECFLTSAAFCVDLHYAKGYRIPRALRFDARGLGSKLYTCRILYEVGPATMARQTRLVRIDISHEHSYS